MTKAELLRILEPFTDALDIEFNVTYKHKATVFAYIRIDVDEGSALVLSDRELEDRELEDRNYIRVGRIASKEAT